MTKENIVEKITLNRDKYEMKGEYESHSPILCMFTDKPVVHEYNETKDETIVRGWAVNVKLGDEVILCIASHNSYTTNEIDNDYFIA